MTVGQYKDFDFLLKIPMSTSMHLTTTGLKGERCVGSAKEIYLRDNKQR